MSTPNEGMLKAEGLFRRPPERVGPFTNYSYRDPRHKDHERPVVDTSSPFNSLDETHILRHYGTTPTFTHMNSLVSVLGAAEEAPYLNTQSSMEWYKYIIVISNALWANVVISRWVAGSVNFTNARLRWATLLLWSMGHVRVTAAASVAALYYPVYECLYTYAPVCRIADPSYDGWRQGWLEGQSTYLARLGAAIFPPLGVSLYRRSTRRFAFNFFWFAAASVFYDMSRIYVFPGMRFHLLQVGWKESDRAARYGSLSPDMYRPIDQDTKKSLQASQHRYFRVTMGLLQDTMWENGSHEYLPLLRRALKIPNPYYMWQKAPQGRDAQATRYKNDLWSLPALMTL